MHATMVQLSGSDEEIVNVMKQMSWLFPPSATSSGGIVTSAAASDWTQDRAEKFKKDLVVHNLQHVVDSVKNNPGIFAADLVKTLKLQSKNALAGRLSAITKLARRHGPKDSLAITSVWAGSDYAYSITAELLPFLK
jgi:hypothetical protein